MVRNAALMLVAGVLLGGCVFVHETERVDDDAKACSYAKAAPAQVLRHVVLFKFKEGTDPADIRKIENAFRALPSQVDTIYDFEWGTDVSGENLQKGFTHCFFVSFRSEADRAKYLPHPAHKAFGELLGPYLDDVLVIDYWAR